MKLYPFLLSLLMAGSLCAHAQHTVSGTVATAQNQPLDGAHIHIEQLHGTTLPDGSYQLHGITTGRHRLVVSYIGYKSLDTLVDVSGNITVNPRLKPESVVLQEVVLSQANAAPKNVVQEQRLNAETIEKYSNATLGDALKEIAGVSALKTGSSIVKPVINGLHSSRVPVFTGSVRLEDQQWGTEHAPNLDINAAGRVSVIKGAGALQYGGDAVGGMVLVEPVTVLKDTLFGKTVMTLDSNGRGGTVASSLHKGAEKGWAWNAGGTFKYMGDRQAPDYVLSNTGNREANASADAKYIGANYDASVSYSFYNATIAIAKATHVGSVGDLVRAINKGEPDIIEPFTHNIAAPRQEVQHHLAKAAFNTKTGDDSELSLLYAFQLNRRKEYDLRRGAYEGIPALDLTLATHSANANWKKETNTTTYTTGVSLLLQKNEASADTGIRPLIPNYQKYDAGAYGIVAHSFTESFRAEAGVRYDFSHVDATKFYQKTRWNSLGYNNGQFENIITGDFGTQWRTNPQFTFHNMSASLGAVKTLDNGYEAVVNAGLAVRNPNPSELFSDGLHHSNGTIELGDLRLEKERAVKLSASLVKKEGAFTFNATPYLNSITNFIYLQAIGAESTIRGAFPVYKYMQANALLAGVDVSTHWQLSPSFAHTFTFAYVNGTDTENDRPLVDMPPPNLTNTLRYTRPGRNNLYVELQGEGVFTQTRYPDNNFYTDVPQDGELVPVLVDVSTPPKGYLLAHFNSGIQFNRLSLRLSVYNILNISYRDYLSRQRLYADDTGRNFQLQLKYTY